MVFTICSFLSRISFLFLLLSSLVVKYVRLSVTRVELPRVLSQPIRSIYFHKTVLSYANARSFVHSFRFPLAIQAFSQSFTSSGILGLSVGLLLSVQNISMFLLTASLLYSEPASLILPSYCGYYPDAIMILPFNDCWCFSYVFGIDIIKLV